jgi:heme/copper-type cytochrome/quinol oxidase subunit 2
MAARACLDRDHGRFDSTDDRARAATAALSAIMITMLIIVIVILAAIMTSVISTRASMITIE